METSTTAGALALAGFLVPMLISFLKSVTWSAKAKQWVAVGVSVLAGAGISIVDNGLTFDNKEQVIANIAVVFTVAQVFYQQFFSGTKLNAEIENVGVGAGKVADGEGGH